MSVCRICSRELEIPMGSREIRRKHGIVTYLFPDVGNLQGLVHEFKSERASQNDCNRWHKQRGIFKPGCRFCVLDAALKPEPVTVPTTEITPPLEVIPMGQFLTAQSAPPPQSEPIKSIEREQPPEKFTTMQMAFRNRKKS